MELQIIDDRGASSGFPWAPLMAVSSCLLVHTVAVTSLTTYMGVYVQQLLGLATLDMAGYYASWLLSAFMIGTLLSSYAWGIFADRFGRKPVLIIGVCATGVYAITFGLSESLASALASRFFFGIANSIFPMARIMAVELLGPKHAVIGIVFLPGSRAIGAIVGPTIGGQLAQPALFHPSHFSSTGLFGRHPFLLPNLVVALLAAVTLPVVLFLVPETLTTERSGGRGDRSTAKDRCAVVDSSIGRSSRVAEDGTVSSEYGSNGGIMLVDSQATVDSPPKYAYSSRNLCNLSRSPSGRTAPTSANPRSNISGSGNGHERDLGKTTSSKDPAPLLFDEKSGQRRNIRSYAGDEDGGENSPRQQRRLGNAAEGGSTPLCGPGGLLSPWRVRILLLLQCFVLMVEVGFYMTYPLWLLASREHGGLQWSVPKVGKVLGWSGVGSALFQFVAYPFMVRTIGIIRLLRCSGVFCAVLFLFIPDVQRLKWSEQASYVVGVLTIVLVLSCASVAETAVNLASANAVPVKMRGKVGGVFAVAAAVGKVIGPAALSSLLAWSLNVAPGRGRSINVLVDYHALFVVLMVLMVVVIMLGLKALTLESLTVPVEDRHGEEYLSVSQSISSSDSFAEATITDSRVDNGQRRRHPEAT
ncbi:unnamed protein product [Pylaiella littoralis]